MILDIPSIKRFSAALSDEESLVPVFKLGPIFSIYDPLRPISRSWAIANLLHLDLLFCQLARASKADFTLHVPTLLAYSLLGKY